MYSNALPGKLPPALLVTDQLRWEQCCREHGLLLTVPRRAIIRAMLQQDQPIDAVALQRIARQHHAATSLGTVYRFLRELRALNLLHAQVPARGRSRTSRITARR